MKEKKPMIMWTDKATAITSIIAIILTLIFQVFSYVKIDSVIVSNTKTGTYQIIDSWFKSSSSTLIDFYANAEDVTPDTTTQDKTMNNMKELIDKYYGFKIVIDASKIEKDEILPLYSETIYAFISKIKDLYYLKTDDAFVYREQIESLKQSIQNLEVYYSSPVNVFENNGISELFNMIISMICVPRK